MRFVERVVHQVRKRRGWPERSCLSSQDLQRHNVLGSQDVSVEVQW